MPFADVDSLLIAVASYYDDVDAATYGLPPSKTARYLHYVQRTVNEIYAHKPWPWKMAYAPIQFNITPANGREADVPADFANVGENGALFDPTGEPWTEIEYRNMIAMIAGGRHLTQHFFCVGRRIASASTGSGDGGVGAADRGLLIPDPNRTDIFTVFYETSPPIVATGASIPLPENLHEAVLLGTVAKLQEGKADPRPIWMTQYKEALGKQVAALMPMSSRAQQMPMTTGRRMW